MWSRRLTIRVCVGAGFLALLLTVSLRMSGSAPFPGWFKNAGDEDLERLVSAWGGTRPLQGRLSGGFAWGPRPQATRASGRPFAADLDPGVLTAAASIVARAERHASASTLAAAGTAHLVLSDIDAAIEAYEASLAIEVSVASVWSDLAAAYLERFHASGSALDLLRSLESVEKARALSPLGEALFNRALILEQLQLLEPARMAWETFLQSDGGSEWAHEARQRLAAVADQITQRDVGARIQHERERLLDEVLARWGQATSGTGSEHLAEARGILKELESVEHDRLAADVLAAIERVSHQPGDLAQLKRAHAAYGEARALYERDRSQEADVRFAEAERQARGLSPLFFSIRLYRSIVRYRLGDVSATEAGLERLLAEPEIRKYPSIRGRALWTLGLLSATAADHYRTIERCDAAMAALQEAREYPNVAFVKAIRAVQQEYAGDLEGAWAVRIDAFPFIDRESPFLSAAQSASRLGYPMSAGVLYDVVASMGRGRERATIQADALRSRARALAKAGDHATAGRLLADARALADRHDEAGWRLIRAEIDLAESELLIDGSADAALEAASRAVDFFARQRPIRLPEALLARARAYRRTGNEAAAAADLERGVAEIDRLRSTLAEWQFRTQVGEFIQAFGDELFTLHLAANRFDEAFAAAERLRAREVTRRSAAASTAPPSLGSLAAALPADTAMVWYFTLDGETVAWGIGGGSASIARIPAGRAEIARLVDRDPLKDRASAESLGSLLLKPFAALLERTSTLVIVPDGPIHLVPFAALPGFSKPYLIEERVIRVSVSATAYAGVVNRPGPRTLPQRALIIGNPSVSSLSRPFRNLREAVAEGAAISRIYPRSTVLTGQQATRENVLRELASHEVFHFAGHSVANHLIPGGSRLLTAGSEQEAITAVDISTLDLDHLRLVMLSSCESVAGVTTRSEGPMGLARAFLTAGADVVVASLAPVGDRSTRELAVAFHQQYQRNQDAAAALREAQLMLLRSPDPALAAPESWAYFVVIGAS